ncbi:MAG: glycoside hydrolase family 43 protein [Verrucomicrobiales bacterium]|nr:glycoside hydrolase family 43 protein [Verrucomicrobiales bacterium]
MRRLSTPRKHGWLLVAWLAAGFLQGDLAAVAATKGAPEVPRRGEVYLFTFFRDNGQDGLYLAWSRDGLEWSEIPPPGKSFLPPMVGTKLMRDPCLRRDAKGRFHMVWTTGWNDRVIGYASSEDLRRWTDQRELPVMMHEPTARNAWAPELYFDAGRDEFLVFWATTIPGRFPTTEGSSEDRYNHRIFGTRTRDFLSLTPTELFYDGGFNGIDATLFRQGRRYGMVVKDETLKPERKHLRLAWSEDPRGPWSPASPAFSASWVEGPSVLKVGGRWHVYFDHYREPQYYGAMRTRDFVKWEDISPQVRMPKGARHGTALAVPASVVGALLR